MIQLIKYPNPILKQTAQPWNFANKVHAEQVQQEMLTLMRLHNGIGLSGNQVGILLRVFVMRTQDGREFGCFNPSIIAGQDTVVGNEGCLSFPDLWLDVNRCHKITAMYLDSNAQERIIELEGIDARCFQHELDHLNGICYTDSMSPLKLAMAKKKLFKKKRKV